MSATLADRPRPSKYVSGVKHYIYKWTLPADINTKTEQCTWKAANMMIIYCYLF